MIAVSMCFVKIVNNKIMLGQVKNPFIGWFSFLIGFQWQYTLAENIMESPTHWLQEFIFRHDFEIISESSFSRTIFTYVGNKLM